MENLTRSIRYMWIFFFLYSSTSGASLNTECRQPEIKSPRSQLNVYQRISTVIVTIYSCLYYEENVCNVDVCANCRTEGPENMIYKKSTRQYNDVSKNCVNAFKYNKFIDRYGFIHGINEPRTTHYPCDDGADLARTSSVSLTNYETQADLSRDSITLRSGTVCRYSSGFCHDEKDNMDVVWEVNSYVTADQCRNLQKMEVTDSYYFTLNRNKFAIIQSKGNYVTLQLEKSRSDLCGMEAWEASGGKFLVTEETIPQAGFATVEAADDFGNRFRSKQDLYDYLIEKCMDDIENSVFQDIPLAGMVSSNLNATPPDGKTEQVPDSMAGVFYMLLKNVSVVCVIAIVVYVRYGMCGRKRERDTYEEIQ